MRNYTKKAVRKIIFSTFILTPLFFTLFFTSTNAAASSALVADHSIIDKVRLDQIPESAINDSRDTLHIAYGHTSHGSQIITGMNGLAAFKEGLGGTKDLYVWNEGGSDGALDIDDYFMSGDLGNPDRTTWATSTRTYLDHPANSDVNVVMWSWCGQVSTATAFDITHSYLGNMSELESDYPDVMFVYMTGHLDGTGLTGNLHLRNEQIREYCEQNNKILFDFADIELYDPDGTYYGDKNPHDTCVYDKDGGSDNGNWALEWQSAHTEDTDWYDCGGAHTESLNSNQKAYAAWWLWARLAGWDDGSGGLGNGDFPLSDILIVAGISVAVIAVLIIVVRKVKK